MPEARIVQIQPVRAAAADTAGPTSNAAVVVAYGGSDNTAHAISGVAWSYVGSGTLAGGNLIIVDGSTTVFSIDVSSQGAGFIPFQPEKRFTPGNALTITLAAGGSNVSGSLNVLGHRLITTPEPLSPSLDFSLPQNSMYL